jgi:hypothetical protein
MFVRQVAILEWSPCAAACLFVFWSVNVFIGKGSSGYKKIMNSSMEERLGNTGLHFIISLQNLLKALKRSGY